MTAKKQLSESDLISSFERVIAASGVRPRGLVAGLGDDAAIFRGPGGRDLVVTQDVQVEGRHFERAWVSPGELGKRLAAVNLSDVAAMGARPLYGLFSLVLPPSTDGSFARRLTAGVVDMLSEFGAALIGGNVSGTSGPLSCDLTLIGECARGKAWRRLARPGDDVVVAGALGEAAAGLELLRAGHTGTSKDKLVRAFTRPRPRLDVSDALAGHPGVRGAIDVSDGFSTDLIHICDATGVGCEVDAGALPVSRALASYCRARGADPVDWVMRGGEDYALILAVAPRQTDCVIRRTRDSTGRAPVVVGRFTRREEGRFIVRDGKRARIRAAGWDHLKPAS
jgi:thiamine-monophosphate kinase